MRAILGALVLALGLGALPAQAATSNGSVTGIDGVLYDDCLDYPYTYRVLVPEGAQYWGLDVELYGPDGRLADTDFVGQPQATGTSSFDLCPGDGNGSYRIRASFEYRFSDAGETKTEEFADAYFTMRKPHTRTVLKVSTDRPAYGQRVTYRIRTWDERPDGYHPTPFAWVHLQKRVDGRWVRVRDSRTLTHDTGRVRVRLPYRYHHKRLRIRAVTERSPRWARSFSTPVRLW